MSTPFAHRDDAGCQLAERLLETVTDASIVLGVPRGGVPVAYQVARSLDLPLDVCVVRKLGAPRQPELAIGAVGHDGARVLNADVIATLRLTPVEVDDITRAQIDEVTSREAAFRAGRPPLDLAGQRVILVDDGAATGASLAIAVDVVRRAGAAAVVAAVPVASGHAHRLLNQVADTVVAVVVSEQFGSVGRFYRDFAQTTDAEVIDLLQRAAR